MLFRHYCQQLQNTFPDILVDPEPIFIAEHPLYTSAGVTSGIDMAVSLVEDSTSHCASRGR